MNKVVRLSLALVFFASLIPGSVYAEPRRPPPRGGSRSNVNVNKNVNVNANRPPRGRDVDVHHDVDIDVDRRGCCWDDDRHPVATAAAVTATATVTAAVVGSIVSAPPPNCTTVVVNGFSYLQCGTVWYQPQISAGTTTYIVVNPPR